MVSPTNRHNGKLFVRQGASTGVIATLTMDCFSAVVHRLGLTAPLTPNLIGRWFASILRLQPFHSNIGPKVWPELRETILQLRTLQPDVTLRARGIGNYGDYYTPEGFVPGDKGNIETPWMVIYPLASGFSYDPDASHYKGARWIVHNILNTVAKGGNFQVGIGPDGAGQFHPAAAEMAANLEVAPALRLAQLQALYDGVRIGLCFIDRNLRYVSVNRRLMELIPTRFGPAGQDGS